MIWTGELGAQARRLRGQVLVLFFCDTVNTALDIAAIYVPLINRFGERHARGSCFHFRALSEGPLCQGTSRRLPCLPGVSFATSRHPLFVSRSNSNHTHSTVFASGTRL